LEALARHYANAVECHDMNTADHSAAISNSSDVPTETSAVGAPTPDVSRKFFVEVRTSGLEAAKCSGAPMSSTAIVSAAGAKKNPLSLNFRTGVFWDGNKSGKEGSRKESASWIFSRLLLLSLSLGWFFFCG